jgi:hypothetical protein
MTIAVWVWRKRIGFSNPELGSQVVSYAGWQKTMIKAFFSSLAAQ